MTGKLADTVMSVRNGEQIARKYQPMVYNPSTHAQVAQRAKLKLLSQLSAVMAPYIAMPKQGAVSSRNMFTKVNFPATTYATDQADIVLTSVKLTRSVVACSPVTATRGDGTITAELQGDTFDRVVYVAFFKRNDGTLGFLGQNVVTTPGATNKYTTTFTAVPFEVVIYAYGVRDNTEAARVLFGDMQTISAEAVAKVITTRTLLESDITLSETVAVAVPVGA